MVSSAIFERLSPWSAGKKRYPRRAIGPQPASSSRDLLNQPGESNFGLTPGRTAGDLQNFCKGRIELAARWSGNPFYLRVAHQRPVRAPKSS
jgi:hypothetical protein